ncbi:MAG: tetraacyldisaccharide 4'-kinase [Gemmatimonadota bacterium]
MRVTPPRSGIPALQRLWNGDSGFAPSLLAVATAPLAVLYGSAVRVRNLAYDRGFLRSRLGPIPVISIGNLAVGGTGKTPVSAWLVRELADRGHRPALVTRGYGEDEVKLHRRWNPDVPVVRARDRLSGVDESARDGRDLAVLDDGFQHRALRRALDIVLLSPAHPLPPRLLPRGPFREPLRALRRADRILVTAKGGSEMKDALRLVDSLRRTPGLPRVDLLPLEFGPWETLDAHPASAPDGPPLIVSSIAQPAGFVRAVRSRTDRAAAAWIFADHHDYTREEVTRIAARAGQSGEGGWIATTEKDAVKLAAFRELLPEVRVLPLIVTPESGFLDALLSDMATRNPPGDSLEART